MSHGTRPELRLTRPRLYAEEKSTALVEVTEETIQTGASVAAFSAGFFVGGPVLAVLTAVLGNYVSKQEGDVSDAVRGVGKAAVEFANFLVKLNSKYDITTKAGDAASGAVEKLKEKDADGTVAKVESFLGDAKSKVVDLNKEYDLVSKGKQALTYASDLSVKAVDKAIELNDEYKVVDKVTDTVKSTVEKGVEAAKKAT